MFHVERWLNSMKKNLQPYIRTQDFLVSGEEFELVFDQELQLLKTTPQPKNLSRYYASENYISHTDRRKTFLEKVYGWVKSISLKQKIGLLEKYHGPAGTLLDVGAGTGDFLAKAQQKGWRVSGIEPEERARKLAKTKEVSLHTSWDGIQETSWDVITLWHVLEHLPDLETQIKQLATHIRPGGTLVVAVPNFKSYDAKYYKQYWAAYDTPRHIWHFSKISISKLFVAHGFQLVKIKPMFFDAFYVSLLSEKYKTGSSRWISALWVGLCSNFYGLYKKEYSSHIYILKKVK